MEWTNGMPDWKAPLYECALELEQDRVSADRMIDIFTRLGHYRDSEDHLQRWRQEKKNAYDYAVKTALEGDQLSLVEDAIGKLRDMGDYLDAGQMIAKGEQHREDLKEKLRLEAEEQARREAARRRRSTIIKLLIAALFAAAFAVWAFVLPPVKIKEADSALAAGRYEEAIALYRKAARFATADQSEAGVQNARGEWASDLLGKGSLDEASDVIELMQDGSEKNALYVRYAQALMDAGEYNDAARVYRKLGDDENRRNARYALAQQYADGQEYQKAISIYEDYDDAALVSETARLWAETCRAQEDYEQAIKACSDYGLDQLRDTILLEWINALVDAGDREQALKKCETYERPDLADEVLSAWADVLLAQNNYPEALAKLGQMQPSEETAARTAELWHSFAQLQLNQVLGGEKDTEAARTAGEALTDINAQLFYCHALDEAGYDLAQVYPEGVAVTGMQLGRYQVETLENTLVIPDDAKLLVLERREKEYNNLLYIGLPSFATQNTIIVPRDHANDDCYIIRLLPGHMFGQSGIQPPASWEDASGMIVLDGIYIHSGDITIENYEYTYGASYSKRLTGVSEHPFFDAVNALTLFTKDNFETCMIWEASSDEPICADDAWFEENKDSETTMLNLHNRMGTLDFTALYDQLPGFITFVTSIHAE